MEALWIFVTHISKSSMMYLVSVHQQGIFIGPDTYGLHRAFHLSKLYRFNLFFYFFSSF